MISQALSALKRILPRGAGVPRLTPANLGVSFGVFLLLLAGLAGFYVPARAPSAAGPTTPQTVITTPSGPRATVVPTVAPMATAKAASTPVASPKQTLSPTPQPTPTPIPSPAPTRTPTPTPSPYVIYTIRAGDTLSEVADRYGVTVDAIVRYNGLASPDRLQVGDKITIPLR